MTTGQRDVPAPGWSSMDTAPTDGTAIVGWYGDAEQERVRWAEERHCMLSTVAPGAGLFGPGWENTEGLNAEDPLAWKPVADDEFASWVPDHIRNSPEFARAVRLVRAKRDRQLARYRIRSAMAATYRLSIDGAAYRRRQRARTRRRRHA